jgi:hypothetical protein
MPFGAIFALRRGTLSLSLSRGDLRQWAFCVRVRAAKFIARDKFSLVIPAARLLGLFSIYSIALSANFIWAVK